MSYENLRIEGSLTEAMEAWVGSRYGKVVDIELGGINENNFAAVGYAAVENAETGTVDAAVSMLLSSFEEPQDHISGFFAC